MERPVDLVEVDGDESLASVNCGYVINYRIVSAEDILQLSRRLDNARYCTTSHLPDDSRTFAGHAVFQGDKVITSIALYN